MKRLFRKLIHSILRIIAGILGGFLAGAAVGAVIAFALFFTVGIVSVLKDEGFEFAITAIPEALIMAIVGSAAGAIGGALVGAASGFVAAICYVILPRRELGACVGIVWSLVAVYYFRVEIAKAYGLAAVGGAAWLAFSCGTLVGFIIIRELQRIDVDEAAAAAKKLDQ